MSKPTADLHKILDGITEWDDKLGPRIMFWLMAHCTKDQLIEMADRSGHHDIAPAHMYNILKASIADDLVQQLTPPELLKAWQQLKNDEAAADAAFERVFSRPRAKEGNSDPLS